MILFLFYSFTPFFNSFLLSFFLFMAKFLLKKLKKHLKLGENYEKDVAEHV